MSTESILGISRTMRATTMLLAAGLFLCQFLSFTSASIAIVNSNNDYDWQKLTDIGWGVDGEGPNASNEWDKHSPTLQSATRESFQTGGIQLDGRALIESWAHPREKRQSLVCDNPGWAVCSASGCCQTSSHCCGNERFCKQLPSDVCCVGLGGACQAGRACHPTCNCVPTGYHCCVFGESCPNSQLCARDPTTGQTGCCTPGSCNGLQTESGSSSGGSDDDDTPPVTTSRAPMPTPAAPVELEYTTYYFTVTYYYYYYFYVWYAAIGASTVTSSQTTIYTNVTLTETAAAAASSKFSEISSSIVEEFVTPTEATTALAKPTLAPETSAQPAKEPGPTTSGETTAAEISTVEETSTAEETDDATSSPLARPSKEPEPTREAPPSASATVFQSVGIAFGADNLAIWGMAGLAAIAGVGMVWL